MIRRWKPWAYSDGGRPGRSWKIFGGMMPSMGIQILAMALLYMWPEIGMWLPSVLYK